MMLIWSGEICGVDIYIRERRDAGFCFASNRKSCDFLRNFAHERNLYHMKALDK